jgi:hypothetical protein
VTGDRGIGKDLKGSGRRLIEVPYRHLFIGTKENSEKLEFGYAVTWEDWKRAPSEYSSRVLSLLWSLRSVDG